VKKLGTIGDVNPIDYGGGYIFAVPGSGPSVEYVHGLDSDERASKIDRKYDDPDERDAAMNALEIQIYRVNLGKTAAEFLSDHDWIDWEAVATTNGQDVSTYDAKNLKTAAQRANALQDATAQYGWHEFDSYPLQLTLGELKKRWGRK
jgi:hypothetical protein